MSKKKVNPEGPRPDVDAAADGLRSFAEQFRPLIAVADALKSLGSIEQATRERRTLHDAEVRRHEDVKAEVLEAETALGRIKVQMTAEQRAHQERSKVLTDAAQAEAERIVAAAVERSNAIIASAQSEASRIQFEAADALTEGAAELATVLSQRMEAETARDAALASHAEAAEATEELRQAAAKVLA